MCDYLIVPLAVYALWRVRKLVRTKAGHHHQWWEMDAADRIFKWIIIVCLTWVTVSIGWDFLAKRNIRLLGCPQSCNEPSEHSFLRFPFRSDQTNDGAQQ